MGIALPSTKEWVKRCEQDGEFMLAARHWSGGLQITVEDARLKLPVQDGKPVATDDDTGQLIEFTGSEATWDKVLAAVPERFNNDLMANMMQGQGLERDADPVQFAQYFAAVARAIELLRPPADEGEAMPHDLADEGTFSAPVGRYVMLTLGGVKHRVYYEEAGEGIPILMQHTAGCSGTQWRHLFEMPEITSHFRLIAYDLPYHGKSVPPVEKDWWDEQYLLRGEFLRSVPIQLSKVLGLDRPVFMGCSVGGLMALDLAHKHADEFRSVISLEGALEIPGEMSHNSELWHPQVNNEYKARLMDALMSPTSPKRYRKETGFVYSSGWPPVFLGDLYYYLDEFDLRGVAGEIDTNKVGVHILSAEYDCSGTVELGQEAHEKISGSTFQEMKGMGHFPMSENPQAFKEYLLPVLEKIS
ncbi:MAG: alpha/beta hydrolase [Pseudomonadales bacterium]|nr:alpha/beta hydrolase [Pseudomonadales bacterium]MBO6566504.1 alpha/beta hydrolase [Pseudomonadales bacterium]MBO6594843.1 alpha/beta hydrolase [Pseudomonadales bacterium]MBO6658766.1 alpha/beta hydrolase [Pseudomonadales bacterium]MBO6821597.1 alpha/beta hydrolase [Pseudomonadales bacterium]